VTTAPARAATGDVTQFFLGGIPADITAGSDGNVWFTDYISNQIVKMTPEGVTTRYSIPTFFSLPSSITTGADGNVWFTEVNGNNIGRITPAGVITEFAVPTLLRAFTVASRSALTATSGSRKATAETSDGSHRPVPLPSFQASARTTSPQAQTQPLDR
jgi:streptogramin lyase